MSTEINKEMKKYIDGKNIVREIYKLPNGKIYLKIDTIKIGQLHLQFDFVNIDKLSSECIKIISKILKKQED